MVVVEEVVVVVLCACGGGRGRTAYPRRHKTSKLIKAKTDKTSNSNTSDDTRRSRIPHEEAVHTAHASSKTNNTKYDRPGLQDGGHHRPSQQGNQTMTRRCIVPLLCRLGLTFFFAITVFLVLLVAWGWGGVE